MYNRDFNANFLAYSSCLGDKISPLNSFNLDITIYKPCEVNILTNLNNPDYDVNVIDPLLTNNYDLQKRILFL